MTAAAIRQYTTRALAMAITAAGLLLGAAGTSAQESDGFTAENESIKIRFFPRTPEQIAAFYEGRKFPEQMVGVLREMCFITTTIGNKSEQVIWHTLDDWRFSTPEGPLQRLSRSDWRSRWEAMQAPMSSQATFRWTLLPERLDFRPGESEGGNIVLPRTSHPIAIEARFYPDADKTGEPIILRIENLHCAGRETTP